MYYNIEVTNNIFKKHDDLIQTRQAQNSLALPRSSFSSQQTAGRWIRASRRLYGSCLQSPSMPSTGIFAPKTKLRCQCMIKRLNRQKVALKTSRTQKNTTRDRRRFFITQILPFQRIFSGSRQIEAEKSAKSKRLRLQNCSNTSSEVSNPWPRCGNYGRHLVLQNLSCKLGRHFSSTGTNVEHAIFQGVAVLLVRRRRVTWGVGKFKLEQFFSKITVDSCCDSKLIET